MGTPQGLDDDGFLAIIDAKQMKELSVRMSRKAAGDTFQLSPNWVEAVIVNLEREVEHLEDTNSSSKAAEIERTIAKIKKAKNSGKIKTGVFTVDKKQAISILPL